MPKMTPEQIDRMAALYAVDLYEDTPGIGTDAAVQMVKAVMILALQNLTKYDEALELFQASWYEMECQGYVEPMEE